MVVSEPGFTSREATVNEMPTLCARASTLGASCSARPSAVFVLSRQPDVSTHSTAAARSGTRFWVVAASTPGNVTPLTASG